MTTRELAEKFLIERREKPPERPTIAELEKILNSEDPTPIDIHADGSVGVGARERDIGLVCDFADSLSAELREENERLREALEKIVGGGCNCNRSECSCEDLIALAKEAIQDKS